MQSQPKQATAPCFTDIRRTLFTEVEQTGYREQISELINSESHGHFQTIKPIQAKSKNTLKADISKID